MKSQTSFSTVLEKPVGRVWATVRDFNSYPVWVDGVTESRIEDDLPGTTVGAVRDFVIGGAHIRQRLVAHSDVDRAFTFESCDPMELDDETGRARTLHSYRGTVALRAVDDGDRCFAEWSTAYECPQDDEAFWNEWWAAAVPGWLVSLRDHLEAAG
jgi:hypothetical protein